MIDRAQQRKFAMLRIAFGCVWLVDACFKWSPAFLNNLLSYFSTNGQPLWARDWIGFWINIVGTSPHLFAVIVALAETAIALGLITGIWSKQAMYSGIVLAFLIWSTAEGFGGPYSAGSTDIGASIIYIFVFIALILSKSWEDLNIKSLFRKV
jgi:thiosulfate dehydrogenase (quinone) large subunit